MGVNGIYGLSGSGLDIESMVKVGMMSKQNEYDKMAQKYTKNEWTKTAYLELNSSINTFNNSTLSTYKYSSSMNAKEATSINSAVKVEASASAPVMNHTVSVGDLSSNAYVVSTGKLTRYGSDTTSIAFKDTLFKSLTDNGDGTVTGTTADDKTFTVSKNAKAISFTISDGVTKDSNNNIKSVPIEFSYEDILSGKTFNDLVSTINNSGLNVRANYDTVNDAFSLYNTTGGTDNKISIDVTAKDTVDRDVTEKYYRDVTKTYNGGHYENTSVGSYGSEPGEVTVNSESYSDVAGTTTANFFNALKLFQSKNGELYSPGTNDTKTDDNYWKFEGGETGTVTTHKENYNLNKYVGGSSDGQERAAQVGSTINLGTSPLNTAGSSNSVAGTVGTITVDGVEYKTNNNKITVAGVTYTALEANKTTSVSVSQDVDAIVNKVKSFVEDYNKMLASLYEKYDEKSDSNYKPLTQSQKDAMKEEQITKWEEKAKKGLLYHDQTIGKIINQMRSAISDPIDGVEGKYNSAYSIGISTTGLKGQLKLDEDKLRKALAEDSESVSRVFTTLKDANETDTDKMGVAQRLGDILSNAAKTIKTRAGSSSDITEDSDLNNLLRNLQTKMSNFKKLMNSFEDALYKKYDAMETALARLGSQLNFVTSSFQ